MPHKEETKQGRPRSEDPLPKCVKFNVPGRSGDLNTLKFDIRQKVEICGDEVEELTGSLISLNVIVIKDCPNLKSIGELKTTRNVVLENCPKLERCDRIDAGDQIVVENCGMTTIPETWVMGEVLVVKNSPNLERITLCEGGNEVRMNNVPSLRSIVGDTQKYFIFEDPPISLEEIHPPISSCCIEGLSEEDKKRVMGCQPLMRKTRRVPDLDWEQIRDKNGTLNWDKSEKKDGKTGSSRNVKPSLLQKVLIFFGLVEKPSPRLVSRHSDYPMYIGRVEKQNS